MMVNDLFDEENEDMITFSSSEMIEREISAAGRGQYQLAIIKISILPAGLKRNTRFGSKQKEEIGSIMKFIIRSRFRTTDTCFSMDRGIIRRSVCEPIWAGGDGSESPVRSAGRAAAL